MATRFLLDTKFADQLIALRRQHADQWQDNLQRELSTRHVLKKQHRLQTQLLTSIAPPINVLSTSALIKQQLSEVKQLRGDNQQQRQQIRNRQAQEMAALNA
jgi:hypothetical protein